MSRDEGTFYEVIGVAPDASTEEIRKTGRRLMQEHHPDRGGDPAVASRVNEALGVLSRPEKRAEYDELLASGGDAGDSAPPDPDSYEDSWGDEQPWSSPEPEPAPPVEEEILDVEVEDAPPPQPSPAPASAPDTPEVAPEVQPEPEATPKTKVRTALHQAVLLGLVPTVILTFIASAGSQLLNADSSVPPLLPPGAGIALAVVLLLLRRRNLPEYPGPRPAAAAMTAAALLVLALIFIAPAYPLVVPGAQAFIAVAVGAWLFTAASARHRRAARIIAAAGLREDGTIFGASTGDTAGELLNTTIWKCLADPELHSARGFQTSDENNPFTKAVLLGNRVALLRPLFLNLDAIPQVSPAFYWSPPSLFMRSQVSGVPVSVARLDLDDYRKSFRSIAGDLEVAEFLIVYTTPDSPEIALPQRPSGVPTVVTGDGAREAIEQFLLDGARPVHHVDHQAATRTLMGLEYMLLNQ